MRKIRSLNRQVGGNCGTRSSIFSLAKTNAGVGHQNDHERYGVSCSAAADR